tara:strand:+ start:341 stop:817 length:477 start_codon:yes stop_codon:yes gene_type:complete
MIEKTDKNIKFLSYIGTPLSENSISVLYSANNINFERCELFSDYVQSLLSIIFDTYLGDDITEDDDKIKHFEWCWIKNIENFEKENIKFSIKSESFDYFKEFMIEVFYNVELKEENKIKPIIKNLWNSIFSYNGTKTSSDMDNFIEIYKILENSLKKG